MDQRKIGRFLKELREQKGITQETFAEHLGVSSRSVSRWETGSTMPDISLLTDIADFYDVDVRELMEGERKGAMNEEVREVADKMADYATLEKGKLFKWVRVISLAGTALLTIAILFQCIGYEPNIYRFGAAVLSFLGLVALAITTLYANGVLEKLAKKKGFTIAVRVIVIALLVISARFMISGALIAGIIFIENKQPYENLSGIDEYNKGYLLEQYGSDLDTGLFVFPDDTNAAIDVEYASSLKTGLFDTDGSIFLSATYETDDFKKEIERLSNISCTVFDTNHEGSDYHIGKIIYDTETYHFPAYVASDGYSGVYEYALIDSDNNRILYILLSHPTIASDETEWIHDDYLKKDLSAYEVESDAPLDNYSIYSYCFREGIWSEYSPEEDEGRLPLGKAR